ncbi:MAG: MFS transporter, partial [Proteobacteria bacterium]|nr:MFS transporter [Pseudomonadota bacterium]
PWILWVAVPFGIIAVACFTTPDLSPTGKLIYAYVTYIMLGMAYTAINIPYGILTTAMTQDADERVVLSVFRMVFAMFGMLTVNVLTIPLIKALGQGNDQNGYQYTMILFASVSVVMFLVCFKTTRERVTPAIDKRYNLRDAIFSVVRNPPWIVLSISSIFASTVGMMSITVAMYYFTYNVGNQELFPLFMVATVIPMMLGMPVGAVLSKKIDKKATWYISHVLVVVINIVFFYTDPHNIAMVFTVRILGGFSMGLSTPLGWAMLADTVEYGEWKTGVRAAGFLYAAGNIAGKFGMSIGGALAGWILAYTGYIAGAEQNADTLWGIRFMMGGLPAIIGVLVLIVFAFYKLDRNTYNNIVSELNQRREKEANEE